MESNDAREALAAVERERAETARHYRIPPGYDEGLGLAVALLVFGIALSNTLDGWRGSLAVIGGALVAAAIMGAQVARFKRLNGMWVSGLIAGRTRWVTVAAFVVEALGIVGAVVAARADLLWLALVVSLGTGAVFAWMSRAWSRAYVAELGA